MCNFCENSFVGEKAIVPLNDLGGIELIIENGFLYAYSPDGNKTVVEIK